MRFNEANVSRGKVTCGFWFLKMWASHFSSVLNYNVMDLQVLCDSVVGWDTILQAGRSPVQDSTGPINPILPAALGPGIHSASNRNEYHKQKKKMFLESRARPASKSDNLSRQCVILSISQLYSPPRPITGIALLFLSEVINSIRLIRDIYVM
jgi:hypothetical protein